MTTRPWTVNRPGPLTPRGEGLWTIDDQLPGPRSIPRRMTIVKRDDGLLFFNAIPVPDATLEQLRALGTPRHLILPNHLHALDAHAFIDKLKVEAWGSDVCVKELSARGLKVHDIAHLPSQAGQRFFTVNGFVTHEQVLFAHGALIAADVFTNVPHQKGLTGFMMRLVGFTAPHPLLPKPVRRRVGRELSAVKALFEELAALSPRQLIPSHGDVFTGDCAAALRTIASTL
jgi:hypothetical protein